MSGQHTPGPWIVEPINDGLTYQITTAEATGFRVIAETNWGDDDDAANARLMAAAPELLEALVDASERLRTCARLTGTGAEFIGQMMKPFEAAIAKATGAA